MSITKYQDVAISIEKAQSIATRIAKYQSIEISITKSQNYCNKYYKISKVLQYLLQNLKIIAILIAKSQSICIKYYKISKYCNTLQYYWNNPWCLTKLMIINNLV